MLLLDHRGLSPQGTKRCTLWLALGFVVPLSACSGKAQVSGTSPFLAQELPENIKEMVRDLGGEIVGDWAYVPPKYSPDTRTFTRSVVLTATSNPRHSLEFWCYADDLNFGYTWGTYFGGDQNDKVLVDWRIDENEPVERSYWSLTRNEAAWMPMDEVLRFVREARVGTVVTFRVQDPPDGETQTDQFSLRGLSEALSHLSCARQ